MGKEVPGTLARRNDVSAVLVLPTVKEFEISMTRNCVTLLNKVEFLDIYHYLVSRQSDLPETLTSRSFGKMIGVKLPFMTLRDCLKGEKAIRDKAVELPEDACYMVKRKNEQLETVLVKWMGKQRSECLPVSGKMFRTAAEVTYTVLQDCFEDKDSSNIGTPMGEAGSVDLEAIEPGLAEIRQLCAMYDPENINNYDETGLYLRELNSKSYTTIGNIAGGKADRSARVSIWFCVNATGSSIIKVETIDALKPWVISETGADNNWNILHKGTQDAQELAEEELAAQSLAVDAEVEVLAVQHANIEEGPPTG
ncbi:hypothetical protein BGZ96_004174 [Linnemannia gamsii]|uniref:DDE-1 domain-containing protein n=1 Tax=Linnemannia gamsii TaxID=64522 RepID=A0ABQ7JJ22_9FUNG|nr:hypothetical protein BGZ96_004174 [Linnemannia gamsii]